MAKSEAESAHDEVYLLVKSLSKAEKRAFQLFTIQAGDARYMQLYKVLDASQEYDEAKILRKLKNDWNKSALLAQKQYLLEQLLSCFNNLYASDFSNAASQLLHQGRILVNKGFYKAGYARLRKAMNEALRIHDHLQLVKILDYMKTALQAGAQIFAEGDTHEKLAQEMQRHLALYKTETEIELLHHKLLDYYRKNVRARDKETDKWYHDLFEHRLLKAPIEELSVRAQIYALNIAYIRCLYTGDVPGILAQSHHIMQLFESNKPLVLALHELYSSALYNYIKALIYNDEKEKAQRYLQHMRNLPADFPRVFGEEKYRVRLFELSAISELSICLKYGLIKKAVTFIESIEADVKQYAGKMNRGNYLYLLTFMQTNFFAAGQWAKGLEYTLIILHQFREEELPRVHFISRIAQLICHFELGNFELLESLTRSAYRYFLKRNSPLRFEKTILAFLKKSSAVSSAKEMHQLFEQLHRDLLLLKNDPLENAVEDFYYLQWLQSKIESKPILHYTEGFVFNTK